jgi:hypothetical protein
MNVMLDAMMVAARVHRRRAGTIDYVILGGREGLIEPRLSVARHSAPI